MPRRTPNPPACFEPLATLPPEADRVVISVNPRAGARPGGERLGRLAELLRRKGFEVEVDTDLDQAAQRANQWQRLGRLRALVAAGGDGTIAELLNRTVAGTPLALFPLGTENLLAKYLRLAAAPEQIAELVAAGKLAQVDAGRANSRLFLLMASCGFDAEVIHRLHQHRQGHIRHWSYAKPILEAIRKYEYPELRVYWEDGRGQGRELRGRWVFVFNLPCYARGIPLAPASVGVDGLFNLCVFKRGSFRLGVRYLAEVLLGRHERLADCSTALVRRVRIEAEARVPYQLDGDPGGALPLEVDVVPGRATLLVPGVALSGQGRAEADRWPEAGQAVEAG